jgi:DNA-binding MarR family transcriptional regulator
MAKYLATKTNSSRQRAAGPTLPGTSGPGDSLGRELSTAVILFHEAIASRLGLSAAEWKCLGLLDQEGPATAGRLAERSGFTTGAITGIVDRLEKAGYVRREPNPKDRRSVIIQPIPSRALREQVTPIFASLGRAMAAVAGRYSDQELAAIQDYLERTIQTLRDETARLTQQSEADRVE